MNIQDIKELLYQNQVHRIIVSASKTIQAIKRIEIKPVMIKEILHYQFSIYEGKQVLHTNYEPVQAGEVFHQYLLDNFKSAFIEAADADYHLFCNRLGRITVRRSNAAKSAGKIVKTNHNVEKKYILPTDIFIPFLFELGIQNREGQINPSKLPKFRQINRYLEFIKEILPDLNIQDKKINIVDFGCGKSYLTFAIHYYFKEILGYQVNITGIDKDSGVILNCTNIVKAYDLEGIKFIHGDIKDYQCEDKIDIVVSLHACDIATDYAIYQALLWQAKAILAVPCCHHEVASQINSDNFKVILKDGIALERFAALLTDSVRSDLLAKIGYKSQIIEFIDFEGTPKNLLIRAVKSNEILYNPFNLLLLKKEFGFQTTLETLLDQAIRSGTVKLFN